MDSYNIQSLHALTDEKMAILVAVVLQEFGAGLTQLQFNEVMLAIFCHFFARALTHLRGTLRLPIF